MNAAGEQRRLWLTRLGAVLFADKDGGEGGRRRGGKERKREKKSSLCIKRGDICMHISHCTPGEHWMFSVHTGLTEVWKHVGLTSLTTCW